MILNKQQIIKYLQCRGEERDSLFLKARTMRQQIFSDRIFLYGFVYFSTWCRNNCSFCYYRRDNEIDRYRKSKDEIMEIAEQLTASGVNLIDLTMGEDNAYYREGFRMLTDVVREIKTKLEVPVMISPGVIPSEAIDRFAELGTDWYALYQETHNQELFARLRNEQNYHERMVTKLYAREKGILTEEGIMTGVGESLEDIADSILSMGDIGASQMRVMSLVPQKGSPLEFYDKPDTDLELKIIALLRILYPYTLIPASLDIEGAAGLKKRIMAGANVVTSIIPPDSGLCGVAQNELDIDEGGRTVEEVSSMLADLGLAAATRDEYIAYLHSLKRRQQAAAGF